MWRADASTTTRYLAMAGAYAALYISMLLAMASLIFSRRDFK